MFVVYKPKASQQAHGVEKQRPINIDAPPAEKGLTSWLSMVVYNW